jgi:hypothetical protein
VHRLHRFGQLKAEDPGVKIKLGIQGALDVGSVAKTVLLTLKGEVGGGVAPGEIGFYSGISKAYSDSQLNANMAQIKALLTETTSGGG